MPTTTLPVLSAEDADCLFFPDDVEASQTSSLKKESALLSRHIRCDANLLLGFCDLAARITELDVRN